MPGTKRRLLVAEDNSEMRELLRRTLSREGYHVDTAAHGADALELLRAGACYDLLISDVRMPEMDGEELLKAARSLKPDFKVILVTSFGGPDDSQRLRGLGAIDFVLKPFKIPDLLDVIEKALNPA
ncbi:response regulator [bacterium]|nr:response regulator [bacterium]